MSLVAQFDTNCGPIEIHQSKTDGSWAYYQNGCYHSQTDHNHVSLCAYIHAMSEFVRQTQSRKVLIIGCAGGSVARMLSQSKCEVTVVDITSTAFYIAKRFFKLPQKVRCVRASGQTFVNHSFTKYDAIIIDVFDADNRVPKIFTTVGFFRSVTKILSSKGICIMNVISKNDNDRTADKIAQRFLGAGLKAVLYERAKERDRNSLILAGPVGRVKIPSGREPLPIKREFSKWTFRKVRRGV